jgi:hypothetical protein
VPAFRQLSYAALGANGLPLGAAAPD